MNTQPAISYEFSRSGIMFFSWVAFLSGTLLIFCTLFNIPPYVDFGDGLVIGFGDYKYGIPVEGRVTTEIPQTSIARFDGKERIVTNIYPDSVKEELSTRLNVQLANYTDTIRVQYTNNVKFLKSDLVIPAARIDYITFFVQPSNLFQKLLLSFQFILLLFLIGFCCRQLAFFIGLNTRGKVFHC